MIQSMPSCFDARTSSGRAHVGYGLQNCEAIRIIYVCFDNHPTVGNRLHIFHTDIVKPKLKEMLAKGVPLVMGSREGATERDTGGGYLFTPEEMQGKSYPIPSDAPRDGPIGTRAEVIAQLFLKREFDVTARAIKNVYEQRRGIDLWADYEGRAYGIEVKSRSKIKSFPKLFFQVSESNIDKRKA